MQEFFKKHWLTIVVFFAGVLVSYYFYNRARYEKEPIFQVDNIRTEIISSDNLGKAPIKVFTSDGKEVTSDLTALRFYFWNAGKKPIKREDILEPLYIQLSDSNSKVIDYKILKMSRPIVNFSLEIEGKRNRLAVDFFILEQNDGATAQVMYIGNPKAEMAFHGIIEGGKLRQGKRFTKSLLTKVKYLILICMFIYCAILLSVNIYKKGRKLETFFVVLLIIAVVGCLTAVILLLIEGKEVIASVLVPFEILP